MNWQLGINTRITLLAAGLTFLLALVLGMWKYRQIMTAPDYRAHPYVDIAHRAALASAHAANATCWRAVGRNRNTYARLTTDSLHDKESDGST